MKDSGYLGKMPKDDTKILDPTTRVEYGVRPAIEALKGRVVWRGCHSDADPVIQSHCYGLNDPPRN